LHNNKTANSEDLINYAEKLTDQISEMLNGAVKQGFKNVNYNPSTSYLANLQKEIFLFSGCKTYIELANARKMLFDDAGKLKPWNKFRDDILTIHKDYNINYLNAEYNFAISSSEQGAKWKEFEKNKDRYYLQYRTAGDKRVRQSHKLMNKITLPMSDPFWDNYFPPNGWHCRCNVVQVLKSKYQPSDSAESMAIGNESFTIRNKEGQINQKATQRQAIFKFNPGKQGITFPKNHPYYDYQNIVEGKIMPVINNRLQKGKLTKEYKNGGKVYINPLLDERANDYKDLVNIANLFAENGSEVLLTPKLHYKNELYNKIYENAYPGKCPDLKVDDKFYEFESYSGDWNKNKISNMLKKGLKQSNRIIIDLRNGYSTDNFIIKIAKDMMKQGIDIKEIWIFDKNIRRIL